MQLEGSCHCGAVSFSLTSRHPYPFNICYCTICRKTAGGGGYAINLGGEAESLTIEGEENIAVYQAKLEDGGQSAARRSFCRICASALWLWDPRWPELIHPFASAIDSELPEPPARTHLMLSSRASWVALQAGEGDKMFARYPDESIAAWHQRLDLEQ